LGKYNDSSGHRVQIKLIYVAPSVGYSEYLNILMLLKNGVLQGKCGFIYYY